MNEPIHLNSLNFKGREFSSLLKLERVYLIYTPKAKLKKIRQKKKAKNCLDFHDVGIMNGFFK